MDQRIIDLYDEYTHRPLSRHQFLRRLVRLTGSTAAALTVLPMLQSNYAVAQTLDNDVDLHTERVAWPVDGGDMRGYLARPAKYSGKLPAVIVIHENRGLNPHIEDVTRRAAKAGFLALAPDALSLLGGTPANEDEARGLFAQLQSQPVAERFAAAIPWLSARNECNGKVGCVGFCWGGALANQLAVVAPDLKAAVAFYGRQAPSEDVPRIRAALQLHYAETDERVNAGIAAYEEALKKHGKSYELYMYPGVGHAFHNDTSAARYNEAAATLAWNRTIDFLRKHLA